MQISRRLFLQLVNRVGFAGAMIVVPRIVDANSVQMLSYTKFPANLTIEEKEQLKNSFLDNKQFAKVKSEFLASQQIIRSEGFGNGSCNFWLATFKDKEARSKWIEATNHLFDCQALKEHGVHSNFLLF